MSVIEVNVIKADRQTGAWENIVTTECLRLLVNVWDNVNTAMHVINTLGQILTNTKLPHMLRAKVEAVGLFHSDYTET